MTDEDTREEEYLMEWSKEAGKEQQSKEKSYITSGKYVAQRGLLYYNCSKQNYSNKNGGGQGETKGGFYISQIKQLQDRIFERMLSENGIEISGGQGRILFVLWKKDHLTISEISEQTSLAKNTVSVVVDGMVRKGIVERETNPSNRRQTIISLTDYAQSMREQYETVSRQMNQLFYQGFSEREQKEFESFLARILKTLTKNCN